MKKLVLSALFSAVASVSLFAASFSDLSYSVGTKVGSHPALQLGIHNAFADARLGLGVYSTDNGTDTTSQTNIGLQLAGKYPVAQELNLTGGVEYVLRTGSARDKSAVKYDIDSASDLSVFVGLQKVFSKNFLVEGQLNLFKTSSQTLKVANAKADCNSHILNSANLIVSYVF